MTEIMAMEFIRKLPTPEEIKAEFPIDDAIRRSATSSPAVTEDCF